MKGRHNRPGNFHKTHSNRAQSTITLTHTFSQGLKIIKKNTSLTFSLYIYIIYIQESDGALESGEGHSTSVHTKVLRNGHTRSNIHHHNYYNHHHEQQRHRCCWHKPAAARTHSKQQRRELVD